MDLGEEVCELSSGDSAAVSLSTFALAETLTFLRTRPTGVSYSTIGSDGSGSLTPTLLLGLASSFATKYSVGEEMSVPDEPSLERHRRDFQGRDLDVQHRRTVGRAIVRLRGASSRAEERCIDIPHEYWSAQGVIVLSENARQGAACWTYLTIQPSNIS